MPVRSLHSSLIIWPDPDRVRRAAATWARAILDAHGDVLRAGYFGSYANACAGVGSDLDLIVVIEDGAAPPARRALRFDTTGLPVPADLLVYTQSEFQRLRDGGGRFAQELTAHAVWFERGS